MGTSTTTYRYDAVNRLMGAHSVGNGTTSQTSDYLYSYDGNGNRTTGGTGATATFNDANEIVTWTTGITVTFTYDANGNELSGSNGLGFAYNAKDQTTSVTGIFGAQLSMGYADAGQAERTSAGGSTYANSSLGIGSETKSGQTTYYTRTPGGHLISQRTPGGTYYYLFDGLGSVVGMVDSAGNIVARYGYDPYGQQVQKRGKDASPSDTSIADGNPFRYTGAYLDNTGLYKMGARYYDPSRGRFTQLDPLGGGYIYCSNNPINFVDPTGLLQNDGDGPATGLAGEAGGNGMAGSEGYTGVGSYAGGEGSLFNILEVPPPNPYAPVAAPTPPKQKANYDATASATGGGGIGPTIGHFVDIVTGSCSQDAGNVVIDGGAVVAAVAASTEGGPGFILMADVALAKTGWDVRGTTACIIRNW